MVYLEESTNCEIASKEATGFKILVIEKKPQTKAIKLNSVTNDFDLGKKKKTAMRKTRNPGARIPQGKSEKKFPTRIPVISDRHTEINGG